MAEYQVKTVSPENWDNISEGEHVLTIEATDGELEATPVNITFTKEIKNMATIKKYVSLEKLGLYDEKIKKVISDADAAGLASAKEYADGLATNYDAAGSAETALTAAKNYTNTVHMQLLNDMDLVGKQSETAISKANTAQTAAATAQAAADAAQNEVDALEAYVGTIPEAATAQNVVAYVDEKTAGIATDSALTELASTVEQLGRDIDAVEADYLKAADKTELQDNIDAVDALVDTLIGEDTGKSARAIANEELAKQLIPETAQDSLDTLAEIAAWIQEHPESASAMNQAIANLETLVGTIPEDATATDIAGYIAEVAAAEKARAEGAESGLSERIADLEASVGETGSVATAIQTAKEEAVAAAKEYADTQDTATLTSAKEYTDGEIDKVETAIATLQSAVDEKAAAADLTALTSRVTTAEGEIDTLQTELDAVEALAAANKTAHEANTAAIALKASQTDLDALAARVTTAEAWQTNMIEVSEEEINSLFTA